MEKTNMIRINDFDLDNGLEETYVFEDYRVRMNRIKDNPLKPKTKAQRDYSGAPEMKNRLNYDSLLIVSKYLPDIKNLMNLQMTCKKAINLSSVFTNQFNINEIGPYDNLDSHTIYTNLENAPRDFMKGYIHVLSGTATSYKDYLHVTLSINRNYDLINYTKELPFELMELIMTYLNTIRKYMIEPSIVFGIDMSTNLFVLKLLEEILDLGKNHPFIKKYIIKKSSYYSINGIRIPIKIIKDLEIYEKELNLIFDYCKLVDTSVNEDFNDLIFPGLHIKKKVRYKLLKNNDVIVMNVELRAISSKEIYIYNENIKKTEIKLEVDNRTEKAILILLPLRLYNKINLLMLDKLEWFPVNKSVLKNTNIILSPFNCCDENMTDSLNSIFKKVKLSMIILSYKIYKYTNELDNDLNEDQILINNNPINILQLKYELILTHTPKNTTPLINLSKRKYNIRKKDFNGIEYDSNLDKLEILNRGSKLILISEYRDSQGKLSKICCNGKNFTIRKGYYWS